MKLSRERLISFLKSDKIPMYYADNREQKSGTKKEMQKEKRKKKITASFMLPQVEGTTAERAATLECRRRVAWLHPRLCTSRGRRWPAAATSFSGM